MRKNHDIIEVEVFAKRHTEKALMVENLKGEDVWLPRSQVDPSDDLMGDRTLQMPEWLAIDKELI